MLEENVAVFGHAARNGSLGCQAALTETGQSLAVEKRGELILLEHLDFLNLMRGAEAVEEVDEGDRRFDGRQVSHTCKVHNFLHGAFAEHCETGLTHRHNVLMVAEDAQRVRSERTCRYMEHTGELLARNFVHIWNHQQQALRSGVGCCQRTGLEGAVNGTCRAAFRLHFLNEHGFAKNVFASGCRPLVDIFSHCRRRRDRIDGCHFAEHIRDMRRCLVTIAGKEFFFVTHKDFLFM